MKKLLFALSYFMFEATEGSGGNPNRLTLDQLDPKNLKSLTDEQLATLGELSDADIQELGKRYPNTPQNNNYLVLEDTRKGAKQLNNTSSWKNLADLRGPLNQKWWKVKTIKSKFTVPKPKAEAPIQDLTKQDVAGAEGLKQKVADPQNLTAIPGGAKENTELKQDVSGAEKTDVTTSGPGPIVNDAANKTDEFSDTDVKDDEAELKKLAEQNAAGTNKTTGAGTNKAGAGNKPK